MTPAISIVIPSYNAPRAELERLYRSLLLQRWTDFEVILVDDASPTPDYTFMDDPRFTVIYREENCGPATCRNVGAAAARAPYLFFTDTDCALHPDTLQQAIETLPNEDAIMGDTVTEVESIFGKAVALLGFPGGGILGFDKVWRVDRAGYTRSFSSCNLAFKKETFEKLGRFNTTFPVAGGEDTVLARHMVDSGYRIRYLPKQIVYHVERKGWRSFMRWQITRGRGNYYIKKNVPEVAGYLRLRLWTFKNSFVKSGLRYAPLVFILLVLSVSLQILGFQLEKKRCSAS